MYNSEFVPDFEMAERAQRDAREAMTYAAKYFGRTRYGSVSSIKDIDNILDQIHGSVSASEFPKETTQSFARIFGSYFGEVLRQAHGATWGIDVTFLFGWYYFFVTAQTLSKLGDIGLPMKTERNALITSRPCFLSVEM